jgi:hypothetical protein
MDQRAGYMENQKSTEPSQQQNRKQNDEHVSLLIIPFVPWTRASGPWLENASTQAHGANAAVFRQSYPITPILLFLRLTFRKLPTSDSSKEQQYEQDYDYQSQASAGVVAPASAMRPRRQAAQTQQQKDHEKYDQHFGLPSVLHSTPRRRLEQSV